MPAVILIVECPFCGKTETRTFETIEYFMETSSYDHIVNTKQGFQFRSLPATNKKGCPYCFAKYEEIRLVNEEKLKTFTRR